MKLGNLLSTLSILWILAAFILVPSVRSSPDTWGPRLDTLQARFLETPAVQRYALETEEVDWWPDIRDPVIIRDLEEEGFSVTGVNGTFRFNYIAFNMRDQENPSGGSTPWRAGVGTPEYYTYWGAQYSGYVPLGDQALRHAIAHLIPKNAMQSSTAFAIDSVVPAAQIAWHKPSVDGHPYNPTEAINILTSAGYVWEPTAPNPAPILSPTDPGGNWLDPRLGAAVNDPGTVWDDTQMMPMNHITFAGVAAAFSPTSWAKEDLCAREFRAIGLPIEHPEVEYGFLTDIMMDNHQFDMYALGWKVGRFPDHLYGFFHSSQDMIQGYNFPGIQDPELDTLVEIVQFSLERDAVKAACWSAQDMIAEKLPYIVTVTTSAVSASAKAGAMEGNIPDTLEGIVNSPNYGQANDWTFCSLRWASMETSGNPLGIGGTARYIVGSVPTTYHPGYASTADEWKVLGRLFDPLIQVDPYTHADIPWLATSWTVQPWTAPGGIPGMNTTFWLRNDVFWHDGVEFNASDVKFSLEFARDQRISRAFPMWQNLVDVEVKDRYTVSIYHNATSLWIFYHVAGPDVWLVDDAACWATMFPKHIYQGTGPTFLPYNTVNPINPALTCLIGTGPYVYRGGDVVLGGYVALTAYRPGPSPVLTSWFRTVEWENSLLTEMFRWIGDVRGAFPDPIPNGKVDEFDLSAMGKCYGYVKGTDPGYDETLDINPESLYQVNDDKIDMRDTAELCKNWAKQREYP